MLTGSGMTEGKGKDKESRDHPPQWRERFSQPRSHPASLVSLTLIIFLTLVLTSVWRHHDRLLTFAPAPPSTTSSSQPPANHWLAIWTAAPQGRELARALPEHFYRENVPLLSTAAWQSQLALGVPEGEAMATRVSVALENTTIRQTHRVSLGTEQLRIRFSNAFGPTDLPIDKVTIALPEAERVGNGSTTISGSSRIRVETLQSIRFAGEDSIVIPPHGLAVSDPLDFPMKAGDVLSLTFYLRAGQVTESITCHVVSRTTTWFEHGDLTTASSLKRPGAGKNLHWFLTSTIKGWNPTTSRALAVLGDSLAEGRSADANSDSAWPALLAQRIRQLPRPASQLGSVSIVNQALGGNQLLSDGKGPNLPSRLDRDVLALPGVGYVFLMLGFNDIGHAGDGVAEQTLQVDRMIAQYNQLVIRLHSAGLPVWASTLTPFSCDGWGEVPNNSARKPGKEAMRLRVNEWIRGSGGFDRVVDFDEVVRNPRNWTEMRREFAAEDCLHLSEAGSEEMARRFPLELFEEFGDGVGGYS